MDMLNTLLFALFLIQDSVTGQVVDNGQGLPFCHVCFTQDSCAVTDFNGWFKIAPDYINTQRTLEIKYVGYETRVIAVHSSDLGKISLTPSVTRLESLYVTAETPEEIFLKTIEKMDKEVFSESGKRRYAIKEEVIIDSTNRFSRVNENWIGEKRIEIQKERGSYEVDLVSLISNQGPVLSYFDLVKLSQSHLDPANVGDYQFEITGYHDQGYFIQQTVQGSDYIQYTYKIDLDHYLVHDFDFSLKFDEPNHRDARNNGLLVNNYLWKGRASYDHSGTVPYQLDYIQIWRGGYFRKNVTDRRHSVHHLSYAVLEK